MAEMGSIGKAGALAEEAILGVRTVQSLNGQPEMVARWVLPKFRTSKSVRASCCMFFRFPDQREITITIIYAPGVGIFVTSRFKYVSQRVRIIENTLDTSGPISDYYNIHSDTKSNCKCHVDSPSGRDSGPGSSVVSSILFSSPSWDVGCCEF